MGPTRGADELAGGANLSKWTLSGRPLYSYLTSITKRMSACAFSMGDGQERVMTHAEDVPVGASRPAVPSTWEAATTRRNHGRFAECGPAHTVRSLRTPTQNGSSDTQRKLPQNWTAFR